MMNRIDVISVRSTSSVLPAVQKKGDRLIAQNQNTYEKRKREMDKKLKADAKRARKNQRKNGDSPTSSHGLFGYEFKKRDTTE
ncbi:MAG: hypothetical protein R3C59_22125 [Planctomycetaceae bacterium]